MKSEEAERAIRIPAMSREDRTQKVNMTTNTASSGNQALTAQDALAYLKDVKDIFHDKNEIFLEFLDIMKDFKAKRITTEGIILRVKELFRGYPSLILGFGAFLPKGYEITLPPPEEKKHAEFDEAITLPPQEKKEKKPAEFEEAINFVNKIKTRFEDDVHIYKSFLDILYMYREEKKSIKQVYNEMSSLFKNHQDLQNEFTHFLPEISTISHTSPHRHDVLQHDKSFTPVRRPGCMEKFGEGAYASNLDHGITVHHHDLDHDKLRIRAGKEKYRKGEENKRESCKNGKDIEHQNRESGMHRISQGVEDLDAELMLQGERIPHPIRLKIRDKQTLQQMNEENTGTNCDRGRDDKLDVMAEDVSLPRKDLPSNNISSLSKEDVNISELDWSNCLRCTPSYRLLPKHYMVPLSSHRTDADAAVLNDVWVSVTSGSEEYSFLRKNQYEEVLSKCEDDRFEMDMLVESVNATTKRVEDLLEKMQDSSNKTGSPIKIENYLSALSLRCIERLYGDHGLEVTDFLQKNACVALPVILTRLKQKQEEWFRCRAEFRKVWTEVYAKNYHKSLDHCSFYFKVQDVKNLCKKALLTEIEDISRKKQDEDKVLVAITEGNQWPIVSAMAFELNDSDIHKDLYEIIQHSCGEICSSREQMDKLMRTWTEFMEPLLGIHMQPKNAEETKDAEKSKRWSSQIIQKDTSKSENGNAGNHLNEAGEEDPFVQDEIYVQRAMFASNDETDTEGTLVDTDKASLQIDSIDSASLLQNVQEESEHHAMDFSNDSCADIRYEGEESAQRFIGERENAPKSGNGDLDCSSGKAGEHAPENSEEGAMYNDWDSHIESEEEVRDMVDALDVDGEGMYFSSKNFLHAVALSELVPPALHENEAKCCQIFYGNDPFYVLIRLYQILYERILLAKMNSRSDEQKRTSTNHNDLPHGYARFMCALYNLLGGLIDNIKFEDECRATIGTQSYVLFTLDNLVYKVVKQLQLVASDEICNDILQLHAYEESRKPERFCSILYYKNARALLHDENIYRFECSSCPTYLSIQLMEYGYKKPTVTSVSTEPRFSAYLCDDIMSGVLHGKQMRTVFLKRNKRKKTNSDECPLPYKGMEDFWMINGLECRISCNSSIVSYVLDTEDFLFRKKRRTCLAGPSCRNSGNPLKATKVQNFHQFLARCLKV